jgi:hypothetical protein
MTRQLALLVGAAVLALFAMPARLAGAAEPTTAACLAASERAVALRQQHKLGDARAELLICSSASCPADVRDECLRHVDEVNAKIPTIVFEAKDASGNDLAAVKVAVDGRPVAERLDGIPLPLDPGEHLFTFQTAGQPSIEKHLVVREAEKERRERIVFGAPAASILATPSGAPHPREDSGRGLGTQRILAIVAAGVGVVGLGLGIGYGLDAKSKRDTARADCPTPTCPDMNGSTLWDSAVSAGNVATIAFVVSGAALATGAVLWFTAKPGSRERDGGTQVGFGPGTLQLRGTW